MTPDEAFNEFYYGTYGRPDEHAPRMSTVRAGWNAALAYAAGVCRTESESDETRGHGYGYGYEQACLKLADRLSPQTGADHADR